MFEGIFLLETAHIIMNLTVDILLASRQEPIIHKFVYKSEKVNDPGQEGSNLFFFFSESPGRATVEQCRHRNSLFCMNLYFEIRLLSLFHFRSMQILNRYLTLRSAENLDCQFSIFQSQGWKISSFGQRRLRPSVFSGCQKAHFLTLQLNYTYGV